MNQLSKAAITNTTDSGLNQGSPSPRQRTGNGLRPVKNWAAQQEVNVGQASKASSATPHHSPSLSLLPEPPLPLSVEKLSSMKLVPGAKKLGDHWLKQQKCISSQSWSLQVQDQDGWFHSEASLLGLQMATFFHCLHMIFPLSMSVS